MKKPIFVCIATMMAAVALAQAPGGGGQRMMVARGTSAPQATGPIAEMVAKIADAINKQDAAALTKLVSTDAVLVDEDGHFDPVNLWIRKLTSTGTKTMTVLDSPRLSPLRVAEMGDTAWAAFNYNLRETVTPRGQSTSSPNEINGIATIVFRRNGADWQAVLIHIAVRGNAITPH